MKRIWKLGKPIRFHNMGARFMMIEFEDQSDKPRVLHDRPWNFDKCLILLKELDGGQQVKNITMNKNFFWVRVYDLPLMAHNEYTGQVLGKAKGRFIKVDLD